MNDFLIHTYFLTMITISLFYNYEKVYIFMNIWMIGKDSVKHHYLKKNFFYSHLNTEDITDADYPHTKKVSKDFEIKNLGEYHHLYVQSDTLLLANVFDNFRNMCHKIYDFDPAKFLSAHGLA